MTTGSVPPEGAAGGTAVDGGPPAVARPAAGTLGKGGLRRVLAVLCVTEVSSWAVLYYAFPVLAPAIGADTGWSAATVTGAFSASLATSAVVGVPVGWLLDRWGPRLVMTAGSVLAGPAVLTIATARSFLMFLAGWVLAGAAMAAVLYQPAFAALTRWWGPRRVTALTGLTLVAGLASTVSAPLTAWLGGGFGWRNAYLVLAAGLIAITVPAHAIGLAGPWPRHTGDPDGDPGGDLNGDVGGGGRGDVAGCPDGNPDSAAGGVPDLATDRPGAVPRSRAFVLLSVAMSLASFSVYAVVINLVPLLTGRGMSTQLAAWALGLSGVGQVCGRMGYGRLSAGTSVRVRTALVLAGCAASIALLSVLPGPTGLLIAASMLVGSVRGLYTLLLATAVSDRWGTLHYGRLSGLLSAPVLLANAAAPWAGTVLAGFLGGYPAAFAVLAGIGALAALLATQTAPPLAARRSGP